MKKFLMVLGIIFLVLIVIFLIFGGIAFFNSYKLMPSIQNFIADFYKNYNDQNFSYIWNKMADEKFKSTGTDENYEKLMSGVYQKLGTAGEHKKGAWRIYYNTDGIYFSIQYSTTYKNGNSVDTFALKKHNKSWLLISYNVNSKELLVK